MAKKAHGDNKTCKRKLERNRFRSSSTATVADKNCFLDDKLPDQLTDYFIETENLDIILIVFTDYCQCCG